MKKKLGIGISVVVLLLMVGYFYVYHGHRDIANEEESYTVAVKTLFSDYQNNEMEADKKYLNQTLIVSGNITSVSIETHSLVLDEKMFAVFSDKIVGEIKLNSKIKIKGRLIGYDSLLEELKMDQCIILN